MPEQIQPRQPECKHCRYSVGKYVFREEKAMLYCWKHARLEPVACADWEREAGADDE